MVRAGITIGELITRGPGYVRDFVTRPHDESEFAPEFSWLLLAESVGVQVGLKRNADPALAARWAEIGAILYEGLVRGLRPQDEIARELWARTAAHYRALSTASPTSLTAPPTTPEPHPI